MASSKGGLNLPITVNDQGVKKSFNEINREYFKLRNSVGKLEEGTDEWTEANKRLAKVETDRKGMIDRQKAFRQEIVKTTEAQEGNTSALNEFTQSFADAFSAAREGDIMGFQEGMQGVAGGIKTATRAGLAFIATPIGAAIAALAAIALATKEWLDYNKAALEANEITQQLTGLTGDALDQARVRAKSMEKTFGTDFKENLGVARNLVQAFGISYEEAFDKIENGLIRGGQQNDDFLQSLREYPKLFAQAGFSVEDFQRIINTGIDLGVYDDKLPDAIKEFSLSMMEETTASRDALENAFGREFTDKLFTGIQNGSMTSKDALQLISEEAETIGLNAQQAQQLTADLFRGAGEDAGGALLIFQAVNTALAEEERELTGLEKALARTSEANLELAQAKDEALKSDGYAKLSNDASVAWTKIKTGFYEALAFITNGLDQMMQFTTRTITQVQAVVLALPGIVSTGLVSVKNEVLDVVKTFGGLSEVVGKLLQFDFDGAKAAAIDFKNNFTREANDVKSSAQDMVNSIMEVSDTAGKLVDKRFEDARAAAVQNASITPPDGSGVITGGNTGGGSGTGGGSEEDNTDQEADKRAAKEIATREKVAAILKEWEEERKMEEELKKFEKDKQAEEREIMELEAKFAKLEEQAAGERELLAALEEEKQLQLQEVRDKYAAERMEKDKVEKEKLGAQEKKWAAASEQATVELEKAKTAALQVGVSTLMGLFDKKSAIYKGMFLLEKGLAAGEVITTSSKALATIAANTAAANAAAVAASPLTAGMPWVAINTATGAKQAVTTKINAAIQLASIAGTAIQGFVDGGPTDLFGMGFKDKTGHEVAGIVHTNEYVVPEVVRRDPEVPAILDYLEGKRKRKLGLYADGGDTAEGTAETATRNSSRTDSSDRVEQLLETLIEVSASNKDILFGAEAELKRQEQQKKLDQLKTRSKIKKA